MKQASGKRLFLIGIVIPMALFVSNLIYYEWIRHFVDMLANDNSLDKSCNEGLNTACEQLIERFSLAQSYAYAIYSVVAYFVVSWFLTFILLRSRKVVVIHDASVILLLTISVSVAAVLAEVVSIAGVLALTTIPVVFGVLCGCWSVGRSQQNKARLETTLSGRSN